MKRKIMYFLAITMATILGFSSIIYAIYPTEEWQDYGLIDAEHVFEETEHEVTEAEHEFVETEHEFIQDYDCLFTNDHIFIHNDAPIGIIALYGDDVTFFDFTVSIFDTADTVQLLKYEIFHEDLQIEEKEFPEGINTYNVNYSVESVTHLYCGEFKTVIHYEVNGVEKSFVAAKFSLATTDKLLDQNGFGNVRYDVTPQSTSIAPFPKPGNYDWIANVVNIAVSQLGVTQDRNGRNPYTGEMVNRTLIADWCGDFVAWVFKQAGYGDYTQYNGGQHGPYAGRGWNFSYARNWWNQPTDYGGSPFHRVRADSHGTVPRRGDVIVWESHVAIVESVNTNTGALKLLLEGINREWYPEYSEMILITPHGVHNHFMDM